MQNFDNETSTE